MHVGTGLLKIFDDLRALEYDGLRGIADGSDSVSRQLTVGVEVWVRESKRTSILRAAVAVATRHHDLQRALRKHQ
jgi:hypothetical protein